MSKDTQQCIFADNLSDFGMSNVQISKSVLLFPNDISEVHTLKRLQTGTAAKPDAKQASKAKKQIPNSEALAPSYRQGDCLSCIPPPQIPPALPAKQRTTKNGAIQNASRNARTPPDRTTPPL